MASTHPTIGVKIKQLRDQQGWSLRELGARSGIHYSQIGDWERQEADPSYENACKLAGAFKIPVRMLWDPDPLTLAEQKPDPPGV